MSLSVNFDVIANQPVSFDTSDVTCNVEELPYNNVVNADDVTQVQFTLNPKDGALNLLYNGDFTSGSGGWTVSNMTHSSFLGMMGSSSDSPCYLNIVPNSLYMPFGTNAFMKVEVSIVANTHGCDITVGTKSYSLEAGQIGNFTFYGVFGDDTATNNRIRLYSYGGTNHSFIVNYVYATPIDYNYVFLIRNKSTNTVEAYYEFWQYFNYTYNSGTAEFRIIDNIVTWSVDWSDLGLTSGCYQLEVCDPNINTNLQCGFPNQDFNYLETDSVAYNSANVLVVFNGDSAIYVSHYAGIAGLFQIVSSVAPVSGITYNYTVQFTDVDLSGGGITMTIGFAGDSDSVPITGAGTYTGSFVSDGGTITFNLALTSNANCKVQLARLYLADSQDFSGNYISNGFTLTSDSCNTVVLHGCSDSDYAFGLNFGSSNFDLRARVKAKFALPTYKFDRNTYEYSDNANVRNVYFKREKQKILKLDLLPEFMLDFVSALMGLDHIYVDGIEYSTGGDEFFLLTPPEEINGFGYATIYLTKKDSTIEKSACTSLGVGCPDTVECLLAPDDDTCIIDPETGDTIISL